MPNIILIKGQPNSGKTTLAKQLWSALPNSVLIESDWEMIKLVKKGKLVVPKKYEKILTSSLAQLYHRLKKKQKKLIHDIIKEEIDFSVLYFDNVIIEGYLFTLPEYKDIKYANIYVVDSIIPVEAIKSGIRENAMQKIMPVFGRYQRFDFLDHDTDSDSIGKLNALNLPEDMTGMRVLDVGCNNGFFTFECNKRGAACVGIDNAPVGIEVANIIRTSIYFRDNIEFKVMDINSLPASLGKFDYILCLSTLHYFPNYMEIIQVLIAMLAPNGILKLEMGLNNACWEIKPNGKYYPSLFDLNGNFNVKNINESVQQAGDPYPRFVLTVTR